jgi:hypothetical protein
MIAFFLPLPLPRNPKTEMQERNNSSTNSDLFNEREIAFNQKFRP